MKPSLKTLIDRIPEEFESEASALASLDLAETLDPIPSPSDLRPHLPEKGVTVGLHRLVARSLEAEGEEETADQILLGLAERLNQAGYWTALGRVTGGILEREPGSAVPLLARARARGGMDAVPDSVLERAHALAPRHGLLAWLTADARFAAGDVTRARQTAALALPELVEEKHYDVAEMALLLLVEEETREAARAVTRALEILARQGAWDPFKNVLEVAGDLLAAPRTAGISWPVIRELWRRHPDQDALRPAAIRTARLFLERYPDPAALIRISEMERPSQPPEVVLERLARAERFPPGYYVRHSGWGLGAVRDNTIDAVVIDFPNKPMHRMTMSTAEQALDTFAPEDLRVLLVRDPEAVKALAAGDPATLLRKVLECNRDGESTTEAIRKILVPAVLTTAAWPAWWRKAQAAAAADPAIDARDAYRNVLRLAGADDDDAVVLPDWAPGRDPGKNLVLLDTFLDHHPGESARLLEAVGDGLRSTLKSPRTPAEIAVWIELLLAKADPGLGLEPEARVDGTFDINVLPRGFQEQLLPRLRTAAALAAALDSKLAGIRQGAYDRLVEQGQLADVLPGILGDALAHPEAALHLLDADPVLDLAPEARAYTFLIATLDLLERPPREPHRKRALALLDGESPLARSLRGVTFSREQEREILFRLTSWQSSDRFRFPVVDLLQDTGHPRIAESVEGSRARMAAKVSERMNEPEDPYEGSTLLTRPTLERLREERHRIGMELKTIIPASIQKARELGDLKENAEYDAAKAKQASHAKRFEELETLLNGVRIIEDLPREPETVVPGTEVHLEPLTGGESQRFWLLGEGDQDLGPDVVSYKATVGQVLLGRKVGDEVEVPRATGSARFRIREVRERLP